MTFLDMTTDDTWPDSTAAAYPKVVDREGQRRRIIAEIVKMTESALDTKTRAVARDKKAAQAVSISVPSAILDWDDILESCSQRNGVVALIRIMVFHSIADRIIQLINLDDELDPDDSPLSLNSLKGFAKYLRNERRLEPPHVITISPDGSLSVEWHYAGNKHLLIKFLDKDKASFASIAPTRGRADETKSLHGTGPWSEIVDSLAPIRVTRWTNG